MTPEEYEIFVKKDFETRLHKELGYPVAVKHLEKLVAPDGNEHVIDLNYEFIIGGAKYLNIVECKHWNKLVTREALMALKTRQDNLRAHKAIMVTNGGFQTGAIKFAQTHNIGLIVLREGLYDVWMGFTGERGETERTVVTEYKTSYNSKEFTMEGIFYPREDDFHTHLINALGIPLIKYMLSFDDKSVDIDDPNLEVPGEIVMAIKNVDPDWYRNYKIMESAGLGFWLYTEELARPYFNRLNLLKIKIGIEA